MIDEAMFGTDVDMEIETDLFILSGHAYTCNGGNSNVHRHHSGRFLMERQGRQLVCPGCGRTQPVRRLPPPDHPLHHLFAATKTSEQAAMDAFRQWRENPPQNGWE